MTEQITAGNLPRILPGTPFRSSQPDHEPTFLVAVSDSEARNALAAIFRAFSLSARWVSTAQAAEDLLDSEGFAACLCGFTLEGGTYQEVARSARRQPIMVPVVMVSAPRPLNEYQDYLASMRAGAFDFISYPYERGDVARILRRAAAAHYASARAQIARVGVLRFDGAHFL